MKTPLTILLVEDDMVDVMSVKRALRELKSEHSLKSVGNGEEALAYLHNTAHPAPDIILLDINMPRMNGLDFLKHLKSDERLRRIPAVVLTTSKEERDRLESFNLSAAGYMVKPVEYAGFVEVIRTIQNYWLLSEAPPGSS
jgi:CheY-like chemotaxis protein